MFGVLNDNERDDDTATTAMLTDLDKMDSESEGDSDDGEDFAAENPPRPPPETPMYGGNGKSYERAAECIKPRAGHRNEPPRTLREPGVRDFAYEHKRGERDIATSTSAHCGNPKAPKPGATCLSDPPASECRKPVSSHKSTCRTIREPGVRDIAYEHKRGDRDIATSTVVQ